MPERSDSPTSPFPTGIGRPAANALAHAGFTHLEQLTEVTEKHVLHMHGIGPKAVGMLKLALQARGLVFRE